LTSRRLFVVAGLLALVLAISASSLGEIAGTIALLGILMAPLALSVAALLDAARRPEWVWALAGRARVLWMVSVIFGVVVLPLGLAISGWYLLRIRPELRDAESGILRGD
jgi:hypothetical protein